IGVEIRPHLLEPGDRAPPVRGLGGQHARGNRARRRADDHLKGIASARIDFRQRPQHADLIRRTRAAAGEHQPANRPLVAPTLGLWDRVVHRLPVSDLPEGWTVRQSTPATISSSQTDCYNRVMVTRRLASTLFASICVFAVAAASSSAWGEPTPGSPAPAFRLPDQNGRLISLADQRGKWVVLYFYAKD